MSVSKFRVIPSQSSSELFDGKLSTTVATTGTADATAQNLNSYLSLQGASEALLFIEVTAKNSGGGSDATNINVKFRVSAEKSCPTLATDSNWAWIRSDNLDSATGVSTTKPYIAKIENVNTDFDSNIKNYVLSVPARGSYISARIWTDNACAIKAKWMRK
jgi:hypothetical protein